MENLQLSKIKIGVIGSGTMGSGIAQIAAANKHDVALFDIDNDALMRSEKNLNNIFNRLVEKKKISEDESKQILGRINFTTDVNNLSSSRFVFEAAIEKLDVKQKLFQQVEKILDEEAILATNTSSLSVTAIASECNKPERIIGTHFFNPPPLLPLVEIVPGLLTNTSVVESIKILMNSWNKVPVIAKDTPGFIVNKVARPFYGEALRILDEGIADVPTIDWAMKEIGKFKMGPFELMDLIGNDVNYKVTETVFEQYFFDPRYKPSFTQKRLVDAKLFGRKSGRGFYDYATDAVKPKHVEDENLGIEIFFRILSMLINEAADTLMLRIASKEDIDSAMKKGVNYPKGLFEWADEIGVDKIVKRLSMLHELYGEDRYRVCPLLKNGNRKEKIL
ncbi:MAG: hypothetical protein K9J16_04730 [Melioribacteraceae bacterium]|nr:hypothetical protein [Melioribacteraceae bacterium]MCF8356537.1 hypothetical protein [Melioribacteraceae bacterium]MCF8393275.1 hypothetical protein [Melioribacteraceae bacterium]MCF8417576.1 hypothetical protein [Melioribacteraceae bacterium]